MIKIIMEILGKNNNDIYEEIKISDYIIKDEKWDMKKYVIYVGRSIAEEICILFRSMKYVGV